MFIFFVFEAVFVEKFKIAEEKMKVLFKNCSVKSFCLTPGLCHHFILFTPWFFKYFEEFFNHFFLMLRIGIRVRVFDNYSVETFVKLCLFSKNSSKSKVLYISFPKSVFVLYLCATHDNPIVHKWSHVSLELDYESTGVATRSVATIYLIQYHLHSFACGGWFSGFVPQ